MFEQLFPRFHQRYEAFLFRDLLARFTQWLIDTEYGQDRTREHVRRLRQALELAGLPLVAIFCSADLEQLFARSPRNAHFAATRGALTRFLTDHGQWQSDVDVRLHADILDAYRDHLCAVRGLSPPTVAQHISTVDAFLAETLPVPGMKVIELTREQIGPMSLQLASA